MKPSPLLTSLLLAVTAATAPAAEQLLINWNQNWKYFHTMSDDPTLDDATIDNAGAGVAPNAGPDLIYTNFNGTANPAGAWFAKESDFTGASGYATLFGKGFNIDGVKVGDNTNYSSYDGGQGPGPIGYDVMDYFGRGLEFTAFATGLTQTAANRRFASYFRTTFTAAQDFSKPRIRMLIDDNAVIYYDGVQVAYLNRSNNQIAYSDVGSTDTTATNNEEGLTTGNGNERVLQSFRLDQAGGPGVNTLTVGAQADSFVTTVVPRITAGTHTIAIIVRNSGNNSTDLGMAFQLYGDDAGISAIVNSTARQAGVDPVDPSDDTFTASVTVIKLGTASTAWTSDVAPSVPGPYAYDTAYTFGPFPATTPVVVNFTATGDPTLTATTQLTPPAAPAVVGTNSVGGDPVIRISTAYAPWTQMAGLPGDRRIQLNNGNALTGVITDPLALTAGTQKAVTVSLEYADTSTGSNAETNDSIRVELVTDVGTVNLTAAYDADGTSPSNGAAMNGEDDANIAYSDELNPDNLNEDNTFDAHWLLAGVVPANATTMQIRILANNDSPTEFLRVGNIQVKPHADTDGDGVSDLFEEVAGTDPNNAASNFRIVSHSITGGQATITVTSVSTRRYEFLVSNDLITWTRAALPGLPPALFEQNTPGNDGNLALTRPVVDPNRGFGRIVVHLPTTNITTP